MWLAMQYSYAGSRFLWKLDDNTLTLDELAMKQHELDRLAVNHQTLPVVYCHEELLAVF